MGIMKEGRGAICLVEKLSIKKVFLLYTIG
jgi:hypothetical protein